MNPKERLDAFYAGKAVDRLPNLTIVGSVITKFNGIDLEQYCKDPLAMAQGAILAARELKLDYVQVASDLARVAEGYGSRLKYTKTGLPRVEKPVLEDIASVEELAPKKARDIPRVWDIVEATKYVLEQEPEIYPMTAVVGPATVAGNMRGVEDLLMDLYDEPELVEKLLDTVTETQLDVIDELAKVGARYIYVPDPVASLLSPSAYESFILPRHQRLFARMREHGIGGRLHMCGNTTALLPYSSRCGAYIVDIDHATDFAKALENVEGRCVLNGNIDPVSQVMYAAPEEVRQAILACAQAAQGHRAMFMPGCELPTDTPLANVLAIHEALCEITPSV